MKITVDTILAGVTIASGTLVAGIGGFTSRSILSSTKANAKTPAEKIVGYGIGIAYGIFTLAAGTTMLQSGYDELALQKMKEGIKFDASKIDMAVKVAALQISGKPKGQLTDLEIDAYAAEYAKIISKQFRKSEQARAYDRAIMAMKLELVKLRHQDTESEPNKTVSFDEAMGADHSNPNPQPLMFNNGDPTDDCLLTEEAVEAKARYRAFQRIFKGMPSVSESLHIYIANRAHAYASHQAMKLVTSEDQIVTYVRSYIQAVTNLLVGREPKEELDSEKEDQVMAEIEMEMEAETKAE